MIKINLATRKQPAFAAGDRTGTGTTIGQLSKLKFDKESLSGLPLRSLGILVGFFVAASYFVSDYKQSELEKINLESQRLEKRQGELHALSKKSAGFQDLKKTLEADEFLLKNKIDTIQRILVNRRAAPELMVTLSDVIPEEVWLSSVGIKENGIVIRGNSTDFDLVSDFMKRMGESNLVADVVLKSTQKGLDPTGIEVASFELNAKRKP
jgi:Tfp pilus assembly protein PilN